MKNIELTKSDGKIFMTKKGSLEFARQLYTNGQITRETYLNILNRMTLAVAMESDITNI